VFVQRPTVQIQKSDGLHDDACGDEVGDRNPG
jgi:hypothetical protein